MPILLSQLESLSSVGRKALPSFEGGSGNISVHRFASIGGHAVSSWGSGRSNQQTRMAEPEKTPAQDGDKVALVTGASGIQGQAFLPPYGCPNQRHLIAHRDPLCPVLLQTLLVFIIKDYLLWIAPPAAYAVLVGCILSSYRFEMPGQPIPLTRFRKPISPYGMTSTGGECNRRALLKHLADHKFKNIYAVSRYWALVLWMHFYKAGLRLELLQACA